MAVSTIAFCVACKWRSSVGPFVLGYAAGAPCPNCKSGVSTIHCDPAYVGKDPIGQPYVEANAINDHLKRHGVSTVNPAGVALPQHSALPK